jgi:hypothetical protein
MEAEAIKALLDELLDAWQQRDLDRTAACFAHNGEYFASVGPLPGQRAKGRGEIRKLIEAMFALDGDTNATFTDLSIAGATATWKWRYELAHGSVELGCDFFKFSDQRILLKDAYRKVVGSLCNCLLATRTTRPGHCGCG